MPRSPDEPSPCWVKSSYSVANGECVELAEMPDGSVGVRDSKHRDGPVLLFDRREFDAFLSAAAAGEFDHLR